MAEFVTPADVKAYLQASGTTGQWSNSLIGSNIAAASGNLQRWTNRQFEAQSNTRKLFTTEGRAYVSLPDLRSVNSVTLQGVALDVDSTYYLIPDKLNTGVYVGMQFRAFDRRDYRRNPEWFDRNLDSWYWQGRDYYSLPNDLAIDGSWGHVPIPAEVQHATIVLAGWYTLRSDALLSGARQTPEGNIFDLSRLPTEIGQFVDNWRLGEAVAVA